ncbi:hypothetical protein [Actinomyces sp. 565]|uniref:hypothetical protein n=1 Tax=Actinomyces sp. 565 TaxID=2057794 RepID=UPI0013A6F029|nr:hypothetical protein [Actinomyces sp. 565]NDR52900.1 hypothetical protein [Actinomyces sp. 565]
MSSRRMPGAGTATGGTFNVLWHGGELASERVRGTVMDAVAILRRLGVDPRVRMTAGDHEGSHGRPSGGRPAQAASATPAAGRHAEPRWADTVLVVDDGARSPQALTAQLHAAATAGPHVILCTFGADRRPPGGAPGSATLDAEELAHARLDVVELSGSDGALLAAAWLALAERAEGPADGAGGDQALAAAR